ncbi:thiamine pyrophosphate-binding protein [Catenulispora yoronensis]
MTRVFGNPGTTELPFLEALQSAPDLEFVLGVHEGSVVAMADGYARATGRPAFVSLHIAAGLANGLVGLLNASRSRTPLVVTAGQQDQRHLAADPMLSGDLIGLARAAVKQTFDVRRPSDLPVMLRRAFAAAVTPPAGPVFLSVPMDVLADPEPVPVPDRSTVAAPGPAAGLPRLAELLRAARRPALVAGDGVGRDGAVAELVAVAEAVGAVVYQQPMYDGVNFPGSHPLYAGMLGATASALREALDPYDTVLIVGTHAFMPHHYTAGPLVPEHCRILQLDPDPAEIGRNFGVAYGTVGAVRPSLAELGRLLAGNVSEAEAEAEADAKAVAGRIADAKAVASRIAEAAAVAAATRARVDADARARYGPAPLDPLAAAHAVAAGLPADAVVLEEAITTGLKLRQVLSLDLPKSYVHTVGGGLGSGIGAAIGSRLGDPSRPVVAVLGDGCALFGLQGLWSASHHEVPVTFVVMNNGEYRTLKDTLDSWNSVATASGRYIGLDLAPPHLDFTRVAEFFGIQAARAESAEHLIDLVAKAAAGDQPFLIDVPITGHASAPRVPED